MNLVQVFADAAPLFSQRPLLRYNGVDHGFEQTLDRTLRLAQAMRLRGIGPGDRVVLVGTNSPDWIVSMLAVLSLGAIVVPVNPALTASEVGYIVEHSEPGLVLIDAELHELLAGAGLPAPRVAWLRAEGAGSWQELLGEGSAGATIATVTTETPAAIFYTSGTTGRPKGVLLSHGAVNAVSDVTCANFRLGPGDSTLIPNSLSFIYPLLINCMSCMRSGATVILQDRFHPEAVVRAIEQYRVSLFMGVPTMFAMVMNWSQGKQADLSSLRFAISAGSSLSWQLVLRFRERFGVRLYDLWGQTEGTPITSYDPEAEPQGRPDSCGRALPGCAVRIVDDQGSDLPPEAVGEVLLAGPNVMLGYYRNPEATRETLRDGWVYTGDLGRLDADGYLYIVGRKRDMIIRGGANIYPVEIEEVLYGHPAVLECAVVAAPDELYGESVKACVVLRDGQAVTVTDLRSYCRERLAEYKTPAHFEFMQELPKGPTGKILKRLLSGKV